MEANYPHSHQGHSAPGGGGVFGTILAAARTGGEQVIFDQAGKTTPPQKE
jgi:hypothetical protein